MDISHLIAAARLSASTSRPGTRRCSTPLNTNASSLTELADRLGVVRETIYAWRRRCATAASVEHRRESAPGLVPVRIVDHE